MSYKEEDCYIYWDRPLKKMEKHIRKLTTNPNDGVLECKVGWNKDDLRGPTPSENIKFLGSVSKNQYKNIFAVLGRGSPTDSIHASHKRGYVYSDTVKRLADQVKDECKENVCAFVIQGNAKKESSTLISGYKLGDPETVENPYEVSCFNADTRSRRESSFSSLLDAKSYLNSLKGRPYTDCFSASLGKIEHYIPLDIENKTTTEDYELVRYFQLK